METKKYLFIDIETFSATDIKSCGAHKYMDDPRFRIQLCGYAVRDASPDGGSADTPVRVLDWSEDTPEKEEFLSTLSDPGVVKVAHNAAFERNAFAAVGYPTRPEEWRDTMTMALYCSLPGSLEKVSEALDLSDKKLDTGKRLIRFFSTPHVRKVKDGKRVVGEEEYVNEPDDFPEEWEEYKTYNMYDVLAEREIFDRLSKYMPGDEVWREYAADADINDRGILVDTDLARGAVAVSDSYMAEHIEEMRRLTGLENPNSVQQLTAWVSSEVSRLGVAAGEDEIGVKKSCVAALKSLDGVGGTDLERVLDMRTVAGKASVKKYSTMLSYAGRGGRARGLFAFYGASHTGRWAGRAIQLQNLTKNKCSGDELDLMRRAVKTGSADIVEMYFGDPSSVLSQLVRTSFVAPEGKNIYVADYSAIEARVLAWIAGEEWVLDVFRDDGDIYCMQAERMYGVKVEKHGLNKPLRQNGKVAVLALGYQGGANALNNMAKAYGMPEFSPAEGEDIVNKYRRSVPMIAQLWRLVEYSAKAAVSGRCRRRLERKYTELVFDGTDPWALRIQLPSGRELFYVNPSIGTNKFGSEAITYSGVDDKSKWGRLETYGGKLVENIVQAVARDILAEALVRVNSSADYAPVLHVHDEIGAEGPDDDPDARLAELAGMMSERPAWAPGLPLRAEGFHAKYYMKD